MRVSPLLLLFFGLLALLLVTSNVSPLYVAGFLLGFLLAIRIFWRYYLGR